MANKTGYVQREITLNKREALRKRALALGTHVGQTLHADGRLLLGKR